MGLDWPDYRRFIVSALVLMFVSFLLPGFSDGFFSALLAAVIAALGWVAESTLGKVSPSGGGLSGSSSRRW